MDAANGKLVSETTGEIELDGGVMVIRRINVHYKLRANEAMRETIERVHEMHADHCPVARSLRPAIDIRTSFELVSK